MAISDGSCARAAEEMLQATEKMMRDTAKMMNEEVPWVVEQWKRRGLLEPSATVRHKKDLVELAGGDSWFVRRNRHTPNEGGHRYRSLDDSSGWVVRRNRRCQGARSQSASFSGVHAPRRMSNSSSLLRNLQARLPQADWEEGARGEPSPLRVERDARKAQEERAPEVFLTLYDLCAKCLNGAAHAIGLGVYHSGIEVHGVEYTFDNHTSDGSGLVWHPPYHSEPHRFPELPLRARLLLGVSRKGVRESHEILRRLAADWPASSYDLLEHNCHDFCSCAAAALGGPALHVPLWVTRSCRLLLFCSGVPSDRGSARLATSRDRLDDLDASSYKEEEPLIGRTSQAYGWPVTECQHSVTAAPSLYGLLVVYLLQIVKNGAWHTLTEVKRQLPV
ncbi:hypothetical protein AB1Y20_017773 [Prymnesium parvum]|uniref:PPPDE domain-containing protein n=1 Tax=Prymnesium parvum TaxID=97485 RepID=A0AB34JPX8_PRYPA